MGACLPACLSACLPPSYRLPTAFLPPSYLLPTSFLPPSYRLPTSFLPPSYLLPTSFLSLSPPPFFGISSLFRLALSYDLTYVVTVFCLNLIKFFWLSNWVLLITLLDRTSLSP